MDLFDFTDKSASKLSTNGMMLSVSKKEAFEIIKSLSEQLINDSPNTGRTEFRTKHTKSGSDKTEGIYFSIGVQSE